MLEVSAGAAMIHKRCRSPRAIGTGEQKGKIPWSRVELEMVGSLRSQQDRS